MAIYNTLFYKNEAGDNFESPEAGNIETHCLDGENLVPKPFKTVWIYWDTDLLQWIQTDTYISTEEIQTVPALRVDNECDATFSYLFLGQGYSENDFRLAQACCASIPCGDPLILGTLPNFATGVLYEATLQIGGRGLFDTSSMSVPGWMAVAVDEETGIITFSGTPDGSGDFPISFFYNNCGRNADDPSQMTFEQTISLVLGFVARNTPVTVMQTVRHNGVDMFVAGSSTSSTGNSIFSSPDAINWTARLLPVASSIAGVAYGNGVWLAVGIFGGTGNVYKSVDNGVTWTGPVSLGAGFDLPRSIAFGGGRFVVVGAAGNRARYSTDDGATWNDGTGIPGIPVNAVAWNGTVFCCVAGSGSGAIFTSSNGAAWTSRTPGWVNNNDQKKIMSDSDSTFFAITPGDLEYGIVNGTGWGVVAPAAAQVPNNFSAFTISNGVGNVYGWLIGTQGGKAFYSTDNGNNWKECVVPAGVLFNDLIFVPSLNLFVAASQSTHNILTAEGF